MVSRVAFLSSFAGVAYAQYTATYLPSNAPATSEQGQAGTNKCGTTNDQKSNCQNAYLNGIDDFCLWSPPDAGPNSGIGETERIEVSWCLKDGYGTRTIPAGTITGAHFVKTPDFVQITGVGDFTKMNIPAGDTGGELDPHGADGNGNPIGGLVFSSAFGELQQIHEWTSFMAVDQFCFRACNPAGNNAPGWCQHIYDVMGCAWNMPANYNAGVFESCQGDSGLPMGVYDGSTFQQGQGATPPPHPIPSSSQCTTVTALGAAATSSSKSAPVITQTASAADSATTAKAQVSATSTQSSAAFSLVRSMDGWDRYVYSMGTAVLFSLVGAVIVL
ncbi:uncharacterized protein EV420DRAFT_237783 [Desarmillaria tabescens]|uniref:Macrofage activating glycoprotein n=1 Tax=Armillaria tabescens TaxID=1929756 RepID=A0AA39J5J8_ARMTA|nr:uncharacterized protein EV420DRAFT_237783 [Desarmillaria tabescens]KAK0436493.1 hypothetical protein EV420DRAFT_237783 [Desarmillaria tabescens]